jgi:hypothetical protein
MVLGQLLEKQGNPAGIRLGGGTDGSESKCSTIPSRDRNLETSKKRVTVDLESDLTTLPVEIEECTATFLN